MSTRPYMTHGGLRIRQRYNRSLLRYDAWCKRHEPKGASGAEWLAWRDWVQERKAQLLADRSQLIEEAYQEERRKKHERKRDRGRNAPRGS